MKKLLIDAYHIIKNWYAVGVVQWGPPSKHEWLNQTVCNMYVQGPCDYNIKGGH